MALYDRAVRKKAQRRGREKGVWIFVPAAELKKAGVATDGPPPFYRVWGSARGDGGATLRFYPEP